MSTLRQRRKGGMDTPLSNLTERVKALDAYAKPLEDFRVKTFSGGAVTLASAILIIFLVVAEFVDYRSVSFLPSLRVDPSTKDKMEIFLNVTFPMSPCYVLGVDVMDVSGEHFHDVDHNIFKVRLDAQGNKITEEKGKVGKEAAAAGPGAKEQQPLEVKNSALSDPNYCGSCYGGDPPEGKSCCNTCEDVRKAYSAKGWGLPNYSEIEQCKEEKYEDKLKAQENEGCQIYGTLEVNRVPGNVHIAPGSSYQQMNLHVHDMAPYLANDKFLLSHIIHELRFGKIYKGMEDVRNPLDGVSKMSTNRYIMFQYYINVVSTLVNYLNGTVRHTNQYSVTENERDISPQGGAGMPNGLPGMFFNFEINPMQVVYQEYRKPLSHFLTDACAIVGGVFTVAGLLDGFLYRAATSRKVKDELGKST